MTDLPQFTPISAAVTFVGAGPRFAQHLTLGAYRAVQGADVVVFDRLVEAEVLALIPAPVRLIDVDKEGFGPSIAQDYLSTTFVAEVLTGARSHRLKGGDCGIFGRLDDEIPALEAAGLSFTILPSVTSATIAAAPIGQSLTKRGRNASLRIITGHDMDGFAEQDWRGMASQGEVVAVYMGKKSARFLQGRPMMHGADIDTPVTLVENVSRPDQGILACNISTMPEAAASLEGPAVILYGLRPRSATALTHLKETRA